MSGISSRVVTALRNLNRYGPKWMRTQAPHWTTADSLALVLEDKMKDKGWEYKFNYRDGEPACAQEGLVQTDTQDPDIWAETVDLEEPLDYEIRRGLENNNDERPITLMVIEDLLARDKMGHEKHGRPLTKSTYSDFHKELYEELMDALVYLRALRENND